MSNLEPPMFDVYMWSISDITAGWEGAISAVHFSAHSYGVVFKVNE